MKKQVLKKASFLYRDGANYKDVVEVMVPLGMSEGDEVTMESLGVCFSDILSHAYNEEYDHNILEFIEYVEE